mmetsp:Transcript_3838/g.16309  ORF Transcript_3838/g.16309 Transcript_3838/m.16309 type:complete len:222 (-) Transcript_3838:263-928(-)
MTPATRVPAASPGAAWSASAAASPKTRRSRPPRLPLRGSRTRACRSEGGTRGCPRPSARARPACAQTRRDARRASPARRRRRALVRRRTKPRAARRTAPGRLREGSPRARSWTPVHAFRFREPRSARERSHASGRPRPGLATGSAKALRRSPSRAPPARRRRRTRVLPRRSSRRRRRRPRRRRTRGVPRGRAFARRRVSRTTRARRGARGRARADFPPAPT